jgi:hypothetical protein
VPAIAPLSVPLTPDPSPTGGDLLTVLATQPSAAVSLVLHSGIELSPANATSLGLTFNTFYVTPTTADGPGDLFLLSPGYNTWIAFPPSAPSGAYALKIDAAQMPAGDYPVNHQCDSARHDREFCSQPIAHAHRATGIQPLRGARLQAAYGWGLGRLHGIRFRHSGNL